MKGRKKFTENEVNAMLAELGVEPKFHMVDGILSVEKIYQISRQFRHDKDKRKFVHKGLSFCAKNNYLPAMLELAKYYAEEKDYSAARKSLENLAAMALTLNLNRTDYDAIISAKIELGKAYEFGYLADSKDYEKSDKKAYQYYEEAHKLNFELKLDKPLAIYRFARCFFKGIHVEKNEQKGHELLLKSAHEGYDEAQYCLGLDYLEGKNGAALNESVGILWLSKAVEQNHGEACIKLAEIYREEEKYDFSFACFLKAAEPPNSIDYAQYKVGRCYRLGEGVGKDDKKALEWTKKAAEPPQNCDWAQNELAEYYENGIGVARDSKMAFDWYQKSAAQNNVRALRRLGDCYRLGLLQEKQDDAKAIEYYRRAADKGSSISKFYLATLLKKKMAKDQQTFKAISEIEELYLAAAKEGIPEACLALYLLTDLHIKWLKKAVKLKYARAQYVYAKKLINQPGSIDDQNQNDEKYEHPVDLLKSAAYDLYLPAVRLLAEYYLTGKVIGKQTIPKSPHLAFDRLVSGAQKNDPHCIFELACLYEHGNEKYPEKDEKESIKYYELFYKIVPANKLSQIRTTKHFSCINHRSKLECIVQEKKIVEFYKSMIHLMKAKMMLTLDEKSLKSFEELVSCSENHIDKKITYTAMAILGYWYGRSFLENKNPADEKLSINYSKKAADHNITFSLVDSEDKKSEVKNKTKTPSKKKHARTIATLLGLKPPVTRKSAMISNVGVVQALAVSEMVDSGGFKGNSKADMKKLQGECKEIRTLITSGEHEEAVTKIKTIQHVSKESLFLQAHVFQKTNRIKEASAVYDELVRKYPRDLNAQAKRLLFLFKYVDATDTYEKLISLKKQYPDNAQAILAIVEYLLYIGNFSECAKEIEPLYEKFPRYPKVQIAYVKYQRSIGQYEKAQNALNEIKPQSDNIQLICRRTYEEIRLVALVKSVEEVEKYFTEILTSKLFTGNIRIIQFIFDYYYKMMEYPAALKFIANNEIPTRKDMTQVDDKFYEITTKAILKKHGNNPSILKRCNKILYDTHMYHLASLVKTKINSVEEKEFPALAVSTYTDEKRNDKKDSLVYAEMVRRCHALLYNLKKQNECEELLKSFVIQYPHMAYPYKMIIIFYLTVNFEEALRYCDASLKNCPLNEEIYVQAINVYLFFNIYGKRKDIRPEHVIALAQRSLPQNKLLLQKLQNYCKKHNYNYESVSANAVSEIKSTQTAGLNDQQVKFDTKEVPVNPLAAAVSVGRDFPDLKHSSKLDIPANQFGTIQAVPTNIAPVGLPPHTYNYQCGKMYELLQALPQALQCYRAAADVMFEARYDIARILGTGVYPIKCDSHKANFWWRKAEELRLAKTQGRVLDDAAELGNLDFELTATVIRIPAGPT